jgi:MtrB/PioB family decaheme-associated outer membrane protein
VSVGVDGITGDSADRAQFGQYNGLRNVGKGAGILGFDYLKRDLAEGTSLQLFGTNLLLETRELGLLWRNQGNLKLGIDYNEQVHYDPYSVNTGMLGFGTTAPQVVALPGGAGTGSDVDLKVNRTALGLALWKSLSPSVNLEVNLKTEDRDGTRLFGNGFSCPSSVAPGCRGATLSNTGSAVLMLPEPINSNTTQVEARVSYSDAKFNLSAGYYGSFYNNSNSVLSQSVPGSLYNPVGSLLPLNTGLQSILNNPLALPPDNQAQFFDVMGNYALTNTTQVKFKLSYSQARQDQNFEAAGLTGAPAGSSALGGATNTTLALIGITSRPTPKLSLLADVRYEDKNDVTPIALYNVQGSAPNTLTYTNMRLPLTTTRARLEAGYQFASDTRGTLDLGYESINRGVFTSTSAVEGVSALRQTTDETTVRAELRRTMSENFSGAISLVGSWRDGSNWLKPNSGTGVTEVSNPSVAFGPSAVFSPTLANRQRDKVKLTGNWQASETLSVQFLAEAGKDRFSSPTDYQQGIENAKVGLLGIDLDYALTDKYHLTGYLSQGSQRVHQSRYAGYVMSFQDTNTGVGMGFNGKPLEKLEVGGNLAYVNDKNVYEQGLEANAPPESVALLAATGGLPNVTFRQITLTLFGKYEIDKKSAVRINLVVQRSQVNDWAWGYNGTPFSYSDGTTLVQQPTQTVGLLGVTYVYRF